MPNRRFALFLAVLALMAGGARAFAADPPPAPLSAEDKALVQKASDYIQGLAGAAGKFQQTDPKGRRSTGVFYVQRPGKARFQYDPPARLLVVSDGTNVSVYDRKLKSFDQYPLAQTPLALLLSNTVRLDQGVAILGVEKSKDGFTVTAGDLKRRAPGRLSLQFSQSPVTLKGWTLIDAQGQKTNVALSGFKAVSSMAPGLFVLKDPRGAASNAVAQ